MKISHLTLILASAVCFSAVAQTSPTAADVKQDTRKAAAAGTLQPAGEAPDPIGGSASTRSTGSKATTHHRRHAHKAKHRSRSSTNHSATRSTAPAPEPMTEPKK